MKKIISLFTRNYSGDHLVRDEIVPGAEWVVAGEGVATRKWDGTCCMIRDNKLYKRYDSKKGKAPPLGFEPAQEFPDEATGHWPGWLPVGMGPDDKWFREANLPAEDGTYELCGPRVQGNPEKLGAHTLIRHGAYILHDCPRTFDALRQYFTSFDNIGIEGVVWHHENGSLVKIKARDFGISRGQEVTE